MQPMTCDSFPSEVTLIIVKYFFQAFLSIVSLPVFAPCSQLLFMQCLPDSLDFHF